MKNRAVGCIIFVLLVMAISGCETLSVRAPAGMFVSTGDFVEGVETLGILQEKETIIAPLFIVNVNKVHEKLYEQLITKAKRLGADGVTNIRFYWKPSILSALSIVILSPFVDFYIEGVAINH